MNTPRWLVDSRTYGSSVRGDASPSSDIDVLLVVDGEVSLEEATKLCSAVWETRALDISLYAQGSFLNLCQQGSLFAWHIATESKRNAFSGRWIDGAQRLLIPYANHKRDLEVLLQAAIDSQESLAGESHTTIFDAGVLGTVVRNVGIILTHWLGRTDFSPMAPVALSGLATRFVPPISISDYELLCLCRRASERGQAGPDADDIRVRVASISIGVTDWVRESIAHLGSRPQGDENASIH